jgi:hypothetical protein
MSTFTYLVQECTNNTPYYTVRSFDTYIEAQAFRAWLGHRWTRIKVIKNKEAERR